MDNSQNPYASPDPNAPTPTKGPFLHAEIDPNRAVIAEGAFTYEDILQATKLGSRSRLWARVGSAILGVVFVGCGYPVWLKEGNVGVLVCFVGLAFLVYFVIMAPSRSATRIWNSSRLIREPFRKLITEDFIQTISPSSDATFSWSIYGKFRQSDEVILLYLEDLPKMFIIFVRHTFQDDAGWEQFRAWVNEKLPPD